MRHLASRLSFVHRTLWQRDGAYRWAALLGPPPLFGGALAALALFAWQHFPHTGPVQGSDTPWAHWTRPVPADDQPYIEAPTLALPQKDAAGRFVGFQTGWSGEIRPMAVDAAMDVNVIASAITSMSLDGTTIPLARILDAGPPTGLFVGAAKTLFVARTSGLYAFSARLAWSGTQSADCLVRLVSAHHRMLRNVNLNVASQSVVNYTPTEFSLEPGLLLLQVAVGCWRGDHAVGPGTLTLMVRRPGEGVFTPVRADELIRPRQREGAGGH